MTLLERVERSLAALGVRPSMDPGPRIGVACSGGGDSVALAHLTVALGFDVTLLHIDHGLRDGSRADAAFVEEFARTLGVPCVVARVSVPDEPSREAAAREVRYAALSKRADELGLAFVLTAHTLDDQAETVLLRATRGGSLAAIAPRRGMFVRPLLDVRRAELREWLDEHSIPWREDPTNDDLEIERNWTRNVLIPQLASRREGVSRVLARLAARTCEDEQVLDGLAADAFASADIDDRGVLVRDASSLPAATLRRVVRLAFRALGGDASEADVDAVLARKRVRTKGISVWTDGDIAFVRDPIPVPQDLRITSGVLDAPQWGLRLRIGSGDDEPWTWRSAVPSPDVTIRTRRPGDRVRTSGGTKKVHDVLIDRKIPRALRELVGVACDGATPLAVIGLTRVPGGGPFVLDAEPLHATWTTRTVWTSG